METQGRLAVLIVKEIDRQLKFGDNKSGMAVLAADGVTQEDLIKVAEHVHFEK